MPHIPAAQIRQLAEGGYLSRSEPVILLGDAGTGKTHMATGLAVEACRQRKRVRFTTAGDPDDIFYLNGRRVERRQGVLRLDDGTLAGSDLTMDAAVRYTVDNLGTGLAEALRMASLYPAQFLRLDDRRGRIAPDYRADLVHLGEDLAARATWIGGKRLG